MPARKWIILVLFAFVIPVMFIGCGDDDDDDDDTSTPTLISGTVVDIETSDPIQGARVMVIDTDTDTQYGDTQVTNSEGEFEIIVEAGQFSLHATAQGYFDRPIRGFTPTTIGISANTTELVTIEMVPYENSSAFGYISGTVLDNAGSPVPGVLVVAGNGTSGYRAYCESDGDFTIFNVEAGTYSLQAYKALYDSTSVSGVVVAAGLETDNLNIVMNSCTGHTVSGSITFLASLNSVVDVTLVHPVTGDSIPGLQNGNDASGLNYIIHGVPDGTYYAFASYKNDGYVIDPDRILKFGIPVVTMNGVDVDMDFDVTDSVEIISPSNNATTITPYEITWTGNESDITFSWNAYPSSTAGYVIELADIYGKVIWGGFDGSGNRSITIGSGTTSVEFNFDNSASATLQSGMTYQWKVYALKTDNGEPFDFKLISSSEDLMGLIRLKDPD